MAQFLTGTSFNPNDTVTSSKLNGMVNNATLLAGSISEQIAIPDVDTGDKLLIYDASNDSLRNVTIGNLLGSPGPIGSYTPNTGSFTGITATNATASVATLATANIASLVIGGKTITSLDLVGMIAAFPLISAGGIYTPPGGWLLCNGALVSTATYANLFARIGTIFGSGSGTFALPDLRGYFIRGVDDGKGVDSNRVMGSFQDDAFQTHTHTVWLSKNSSDDFDTSGGSGSGRNKDDSQSGLPSAGSGSETRPKNIALYYCIKY